MYSIEIDQGVIGSNLLEGFIGPRQFGTTGEYAILANVFEFSDDAAGAKSKRFLEFGTQPGDLNGDADPSDIELKLVHFATDVKKQQAFNFSNIPLQPRSTYGGGSIGIQIVIMEVDANGPMTSLLGTLARFGQQAVPGTSEVKDMIFDLGESLVSGTSQDDMLLNYRFVLSAKGEVDDGRAAFAPGRYVLRRAQDRKTPMRWEDLRLDHNTGRLFKFANGALTEVRDELYLTLNVKSYPAGTKPEFYELPAWAAFRKAIDSSADVADAPVKTLSANFESLLNEKRSSDWEAAAVKKWKSAEEALASFSRISIDALTPDSLSACQVDPVELQGNADKAERDAHDAIAAFLMLYRAGLAKKIANDDGQLTIDEFRPAERDALVSIVARYFMPWDALDNAPFADHSAFEAKFVVPGDATLNALSVATAKSRNGNSTTCEDLINRGLAYPNAPTNEP